MRALSPRFWAALALSGVTTIVLFLTMQVLVTGQDYQIEEELSALAIDFVRIERDEDINTKDRKPKRPSQDQADEAPPPPKLSKIDRPNMDNAGMAADLGQFDLGALNLDVPVDGDALAIVRVLPRYPSRALSRGIEGWVLLEFAIDPLGRATQMAVIDAEPKGVFDRAALTAVAKWKYRPMVENGKAVTRNGVRQLISFRIAK